jgi:hypothetical protein
MYDRNLVIGGARLSLKKVSFPQQKGKLEAKELGGQDPSRYGMLAGGWRKGEHLRTHFFDTCSVVSGSSTFFHCPWFLYVMPSYSHCSAYLLNEEDKA